MQNTAVSFVLNCYCTEKDVLKLGLVPTLENTQLNNLKLGHHALYNNNWPDYLILLRHDPSCILQSNSTPLLQIPLLKGTFQDSVVNLIYIMPYQQASDQFLIITFLPKNGQTHILRSRAITWLN